MSRRAHGSEIGFGSDSFLDIIANIVGILIILIVLAGLRVSRQSLLASDASAASALPVTLPETPQPPPLPASVEPMSAATNPDEAKGSWGPDLIEPEPHAPPQPPEHLLRARAVLKQERLELAAQSTQTELRMQEAQTLQQQLTMETDDVRRSLDTLARRQLSRQRETRAMHESVQASSDVLISLRSELDAAREQANPVETIRHKLTPLGRTVTDNEIHFRIMHGHVTYIPVTDLLEELKAQMQQRQSWLARFRQHRGTIGPVDGFKLHYLVEQKRMSVVEQLRHGANMIRISVSKWEIEGTDQVQSEPVEVALRDHSDFQIRVLRSPPGSTLTFWVYPDSFSDFRKLQQAAHQSGLTVAGRPLPYGVRIAGSPTGTRSSGQ